MKIFLSDKNSRGKERPWKDYKKLSLLLSKSLKRLGQADKNESYLKKSNTVKDCGNFLEFATNADEHKYLTNVYFCKNRLCPTCNWRRSQVLHNQLVKIFREVDTKLYNFYLLTLTIRNPNSDNLADSINILLKGWNNFSRTKVFSSVAGYVKSLEIKKAKNKVDWHPHLHILVMTEKGDKSLLIKQNIISQWQQSAKLEYAPSVDCRPVYDKKGLGLKSVLLEVSKYAVKTNAVILPDDNKQTDSNVSVLVPALHGRRLLSFGGVLRKIKKELQLEEIENADLINTTSEEEIKGKIIYKEWYLWNYKLQDYILYKLVDGEGREIIGDERRRILEHKEPSAA